MSWTRKYAHTVCRDATQIKDRIAQQEKERIAGIRARGDDQLCLSRLNLRQVQCSGNLIYGPSCSQTTVCHLFVLSWVPGCQNTLHVKQKPPPHISPSVLFFFGSIVARYFESERVIWWNTLTSTDCGKRNKYRTPPPAITHVCRHVRWYFCNTIVIFCCCSLLPSFGVVDVLCCFFVSDLTLPVVLLFARGNRFLRNTTNSVNGKKS